MTTGAYSFIDIAVLDGVRHHFASGDPLVLLSVDLSTLLWVNGPGASLFGFDDIESAMGTEFDLGANVRRQIAATSGFPDIGENRALMIRLQSGLQSRPLTCKASTIALPDGTKGILLAMAGAEFAGQEPDKQAARAIGGFNAPGHYAVLIDTRGQPVASSPGFEKLGLAPDTLQMLVRRVANERDRLVKRMVPAAEGEVAAGIGRLIDDPPTHLLIAVAEAALDDTALRSSQPVVEIAEPEDVTASELEVEPEAPVDQPALPLEPADETSDELLASGREIEQDIPEAEDIDSGPVAEHEPAEAKTGEKSEPATESPPQAGAEAVRFVWRTDADGRFSTISEEFASAVGPRFAEIVGRTFSDIADEYGFDGDGAIAGLLARRDTWSGRSVLWPVEGTDQKVPVDLAALPAYSRDRVFEGFRGFGVVRLTETVADPLATGLKATEPVDSDPEEKEPVADTTDVANDPFHGEKPAIELAPTPERRESDKVVRLAAHREKLSGGSLSESEETAFREIGDRLKDSDEPDAAKLREVANSNPAPVDTDSETDTGQVDRLNAKSSNEVEEKHEPVRFASKGFLPSAFAGAASWLPGGTDISIMEQLPIAVLIRSGDTLHYANPEFFKLTGYRNIDELADAGGFDILFAGPEGLVDEEDESARPAMRLVTRDGTERLCEAHLRSVRWQENRALMLAIRPASLFSPPMDGPDGADADLQDRIEELSAILDTATDGVVLVAPSGEIRSVNRSAEALFGFESAELVGKPFTALFAVESQREAGDYLSGLSDNGVASVLNDGREVIGREAQGRFIPLFMTMGKLPSSRGYCAVMRDITQWKRAEEELTQARGQAENASSQKTDFLARISHEVRTPLNAIIGFSELMIDEKFGPIGNTRYRDYLRDINRSGNHVLDLVNDLLDISKIEAGAQEMEFESVSLNDALADSVAIMQPEANRERVIIRSSFASNLPEVVADLRSIKQIALNLLSNAIRFTPAGGQVIVSTVYELSGDVILRVRDTGIGMSRSEVEQALKPFKQVSSLKSKRQDGTGLGLPLTKAMVEANRAAFTIDSKPDEGTIVEVAFPSTRVLAD